MYIDKDTAKTITADQVKAVLTARAAEPWRKLSKRRQAEAAAAFDPALNYDKDGAGRDNEGGQLDRLARDLAALNNAIVLNPYGGARCECSKAPRGNLDSGRHYFNVYYAVPTEAGRTGEGIEMLKIPCGKVARAVIGLGARDGINTGFFSSGAIGMSRQLDATDVIFHILKAAGGVYCQF